MVSSSGVRSVLLAVATLAFALGGCGSLSGKLVQESSLLASRIPVAAPPELTPATLAAEAPVPVEAAATPSEPAAPSEATISEPVTEPGTPSEPCTVSDPVARIATPTTITAPTQSGAPLRFLRRKRIGSSARHANV